MFRTKWIDLKFWFGQIDCWTLHSSTKNICHNAGRLSMVWNIVITSNFIDKFFNISILTEWTRGMEQDINRYWLRYLSTCLGTPWPMPCRLCFHIWSSIRHWLIRVWSIVSRHGLFIIGCCGSITCSNKAVSCYKALNTVQYCVVFGNIKYYYVILCNIGSTE